MACRGRGGPATVGHRARPAEHYFSDTCRPRCSTPGCETPRTGLGETCWHHGPTAWGTLLGGCYADAGVHCCNWRPSPRTSGPAPRVAAAPPVCSGWGLRWVLDGRWRGRWLVAAEPRPPLLFECRRGGQLCHSGVNFRGRLKVTWAMRLPGAGPTPGTAKGFGGILLRGLSLWL